MNIRVRRPPRRQMQDLQTSAPSDQGPTDVVASDEAWKGYVLTILAAVSWATGGVVAKWLFSPLSAATSAWPFPPLGIEVDAMTLSAARAVVSAILLMSYLLLRKRDELRVDGKGILFLAFFGVFGLALVHFTYVQAMSYSIVASGILLEYLAPVLVLGVSVAFLGERLTWTLPIGVILSIIGCALVVGVASGEGVSISPAGLFWGLASAVLFAGYSLLGKYASMRYTPWTMMAYGLAFAAVFWLIVQGGPGRILGFVRNPGGLGAVLFIAVVSTIIPFSAFLKALHYIDATKATVTATLEPVLAGLVAYALFGETFDLTQLAGGLMVIVAIMVVQSSGKPGRVVPPAA
jgi:drug/metabolite transporter (DMT)-like permease